MLKRHRYDYDLIVIGTGAGGSVGAHHAASLGKKVALFEKGAVGGECPNYACVPTKALLYAASVLEKVKNAETFGIFPGSTEAKYNKVKKWKDLTVSRTGTTHGEESFRKEGITLIKERAVFVSPHEVKAGDRVYSATKILIATGSKVFIPPVEGLQDTGYITFKEAVDLEKLPKSLCVLGGGAVACELSQIFSIFGTEVTIIIRSDKLLNKEGSEISELVKALFENRGIKILTNSTLLKVEKKGREKIVHYQKESRIHSASFDEILVATGKVPNLDLDLDKAGVKVADHKLHINEYLQTNVSHIYAAGDVIGPYLFTHTGYYQSFIAIHNAFSYKKHKPNYRVVPRCVFITPEVASVGLSEEEAKQQGIQYKKGIAPIAILGRANTSNQLDGFVKVITDSKRRVLGASIVAPSAGEMIHTLSLAIQLRINVDILAEMIVAYPTYSEAIKIACSSIE